MKKNRNFYIIIIFIFFFLFCVREGLIDYVNASSDGANRYGLFLIQCKLFISEIIPYFMFFLAILSMFYGLVSSIKSNKSTKFSNKYLIFLPIILLFLEACIIYLDYFRISDMFIVKTLGENWKIFDILNAIIFIILY